MIVKKKDMLGFGFNYAGASLKGWTIFYSDENREVAFLGLRPVVTLGPNVQIEISKKASNSSTPHKIIKY